MTEYKRYVVWACFGVDAASPKQAEKIIKKAIFTEGLDAFYIHDTHNINTTVFHCPDLDRLFMGYVEGGRR